jgi:hypothetical protein
MPSHTRHQRGRRAPRSGEEEHIDGDRHRSAGVCNHRARTRTVEDEIEGTTRTSRCAIARCVIRTPQGALVRTELAGARRRPWWRHGRHRIALGLGFRERSGERERKWGVPRDAIPLNHFGLAPWAVQMGQDGGPAQLGQGYFWLFNFTNYLWILPNKNKLKIPLKIQENRINE